MERLGISLPREPEKSRDTTPQHDGAEVRDNEVSHHDHEGGNGEKSAQDQPEQSAQAQPEENSVLSHDQDEMEQPETEAQGSEPEQTPALRRSTRIDLGISFSSKLHINTMCSSGNSAKEHTA